MRYIYLDIAKIPEEWRDQARRLTDAINAAASDEVRRKIIADNTAEWGKLKKHLLDLSYAKCWYTEADDCVGDWHVDHFRPKKTYPWLAFDWTNYRVCGAKPNRRKAEYFPLLDESARATMTDQSTNAEVCLLLDPTRPTDVNQIRFDEEGIMKSVDPNDLEFGKRIKITRQRLDLDSERLIGKRQQIWNNCQKAVDQIRAYLAENQNSTAALTSNTIKSWADSIRRSIDVRSPFSAVAKSCINTNQADWILDIPG